MSAPESADFAEDPVVRELLASSTLMRLAYVGANLQPHVVPIWYGYADGEFVVVTGPKADKVRHIAERPRVSFTIDSDRPPYKVLLVDGRATLEPVEGMPPEYPEIVRKFLGPAADGYLGRMEGRVKRQVRIRIRPTSVRVLDFLKRTPKSLA
jgi:PPOX class probable F420-dependent enzyme